MSDSQFYNKIVQEVTDGNAIINNEIRQHDPERELEKVMLSVDFLNNK